MGLIDSVNNLNNVYISERQKRKQEQEEKQNKKIQQNNYKLLLQDLFYNEFKKQNNTEATKKYFDTLENRLNVIESLTLGDVDSSPFINSIYNKELTFIYNIFKKDEQAQTPDYKNEIYQGIQNTYKEHGIDAYYKLLDVKYNFLNMYNINTIENSQYFDKVNKHFKKYYTENAEEKTPKNNILIYIFTFIISIFVGSVAGFKTINKRRKSR